MSALHRVVHFVPADTLGTEVPWIASDDESKFQADGYEIDSEGNLHLWTAGVRTASFPAHGWASIQRLKEES